MPSSAIAGAPTPRRVRQNAGRSPGGTSSNAPLVEPGIGSAASSSTKRPSRPFGTRSVYPKPATPGKRRATPMPRDHPADWRVVGGGVGGGRGGGGGGGGA